MPWVPRRYSDNEFEYRHVQLPKQMLKVIPKEYFDGSRGTLKLLWEEEWRALGITQVSLYPPPLIMVMSTCATGLQLRGFGRRSGLADCVCAGQSLGWEHYEVHEPEPHILLFKYVAITRTSSATRSRQTLPASATSSCWSVAANSGAGDRSITSRRLIDPVEFVVPCLVMLAMICF